MIATISRGDTSVTLPLVDDSSGAPIAIRGLGKPNLNIQNTGGTNPRFVDQWSGLEQFTLVGRFVGPNAYQNALTLADLIKTNGGGEPLILDIDSDEFDANIEVAPGVGQQGPLTLSYEPGTKNVVIVDLALTRVSETIGSVAQETTTPTASGDGPITISAGGTSVALTLDITVDRSVGRPNSTTRKAPNTHPRYIDKAKSAFDEFELTAQVTENTIPTLNDLVDIFRPQLDRSAVTLNFNGLYGMGKMNVVPSGSEAIRFTRNTGQNGISIIPKITLRRVQA